MSSILYAASKAFLIAICIFFASKNLVAQNQLSVPFTYGAIGTQDGVAKATGLKTFSTLSIEKVYFIQNTSGTKFTLQGNDIPGVLRLVTTAEKVQYFDTEGVTASKELAAIDLAVQANTNEQSAIATSSVSAAKTNASSPATSAMSDKVTSQNSDINNSATQRTTFRIYHYFNSAGYVLESHKDLQKVISLMNSNSGLRLKISSAADCFGNAASNLALSKRRAMYIQSLFPQSVQSRIQIEWLGNTKPVKLCDTKNRTFASEQINRYTEIDIL